MRRLFRQEMEQLPMIAVDRHWGRPDITKSDICYFDSNEFSYLGSGEAPGNSKFLRLLQEIAERQTPPTPVIPTCFKGSNAEAVRLDKGRILMAVAAGYVDALPASGEVRELVLMPAHVPAVLREKPGVEGGPPSVTDQSETEDLSAATGDDGVARRRLLRLVADRSGQSRFRASVLAAYGDRCAITGAGASAALEAAHITPWNESQDDDPGNGILLRADLHALFDANLLSIDPATSRVRIAPSLEADPVYGPFNSRSVRNREECFPELKQEVLKRHYEAFADWHGRR